MSEELSKAIMNRSKVRNRYTKWPPSETLLAFKKQKNFRKNLSKKINELFH